MKLELKKLKIDQKLRALNISDIVCKIDGKDLLLIHKRSKETKKVPPAYFFRFMNKKTSATHKIFPHARKKDIMAVINKLGKTSDHPYKCLNYKTNQKCLVQCEASGKQKWIPVAYIKKGTHPFKAIQQGTSTGELSVISFLEKLLEISFKKVRPDFLKNPKSGLNLELDGYNEKFKIAVEYGSHKQSHKNSHMFSNQKDVKFKDNFKKKKCKEHKITLIQVEDIGSKSPQLIKENLKEILIKNKIIFNEKKFQELPFIYKEKNGAYTTKQIWEVAKQCKNRDYFERKHRGMWRAAERLGIISEIVLYFKTQRESQGIRQSWTSESVISLCKKLGKEKKEFSFFIKNFSGAYKFAISHNLLEQVKMNFNTKQKSWGYWNNLKNAEDALKQCKNKKELQKRYNALYRNIRINPEYYNQILSQYPQFKTDCKKTMTDFDIKRDLSGILVYADVYKKKKATYEYLKRHNLLKKYTSHLINKNKIRDNKKSKNKQNAIKKAMKYSSIESLKNHNFTLWRYIQTNGLATSVEKFFISKK